MDSLVSALRGLYTGNSVARAVFDVLRTDYQRNMTAITISTLTWRSGRSESEIKEVCREFEKLKLGRYVPGRWNSPSRFEWAAKITEIGAVAAGEQDSFDEESIKEFSFEGTPTELTSNSIPMTASSDGSNSSNGHENAGAGIIHSFKLRPDFEVSFKLPLDFSKTEASRIAQFVASLPFES